MKAKDIYVDIDSSSNNNLVSNNVNHEDKGCIEKGQDTKRKEMKKNNSGSSGSSVTLKTQGSCLDPHWGLSSDSRVWFLNLASDGDESDNGEGNEAHWKGSVKSLSKEKSDEDMNENLEDLSGLERPESNDLITSTVAHVGEITPLVHDKERRDSLCEKAKREENEIRQILEVEQQKSSTKSKTLDREISIYSRSFHRKVGGSLGREGPTIQIASSIMYRCFKSCWYWIAHFRSLFPTQDILNTYIKLMCMIGASSGIAAAFQTPLAGILFAIEEMGESYDQAFGFMVVLAVSVAGISSVFFVQVLETTIPQVTQHILYPFLGTIPGVAVAEMLESIPQFVWMLFITSVLGGILGGLWSQTLLIGLQLSAYTPLLRDAPYSKAIFCGLCVSFFTVFYMGVGKYGDVLNNGYQSAISALNYECIDCDYVLTDARKYKVLDVTPLVNNRAFVLRIRSTVGENATCVSVNPSNGFARAAVTWFTYISGIPAGIFAPSLAAGASYGVFYYCYFLRTLFTGTLFIRPSLMSLYAMQGYFSGVMQAPITTYAIISEMYATPRKLETDENISTLNMTLLVVSLVASLISKLICPKPLYVGLAALGIPMVPFENVACDLHDLAENEAEQRVQQQRKFLARAKRMRRQTKSGRSSHHDTENGENEDSANHLTPFRLNERVRKASLVQDEDLLLHSRKEHPLMAHVCKCETMIASSYNINMLNSEVGRRPDLFFFFFLRMPDEESIEDDKTDSRKTTSRTRFTKRQKRSNEAVTKDSWSTLNSKIPVSSDTIEGLDCDYSDPSSVSKKNNIDSAGGRPGTLETIRTSARRLSITAVDKVFRSRAKHERGTT
eukprot:g3922.t1